MMKIGARAHDFGRRSAADLAAAVKAAGFDAVQLALTKAIDGVDSFAAVTPAVIDSVRAAFAAAAVEISILGCYVEPSLPGREERLRHVANFCLGLEHARDLGVPIAGTETTTLLPTPENNARREGLYQGLLDSVKRMAEKAEAVGVDIGIEPVADHTLNTPELARRLLDDVGSARVKIIFDPVNMILADTAGDQEKVYENFFRVLGSEIRILHVKDIVFENGAKVWRPVGQGMVNNRFVFDWLKANHPDIPALREHVKEGTREADAAVMRGLAGV